MFNFLGYTKALVAFRNDLEKIFSKDTAHPASRENPIPSAGHCAVVACMLRRLYPMLDIVSTVVPFEGKQCSHWFNAIQVDDEVWFIDLTGDQFGLPKIQVCLGDITSIKLRSERHLDEDTKDRLELLCKRYQALDGSISFCK